MKTFSAKPNEINRNWYLVDAKDVVLGRLASTVAMVLRGKHKPIYTPHVDTGDFVIVINADKVALTGRKLRDKVKYHHTGYPGGLRTTRLSDQMKNSPETVIIDAVRGMLPKNPLGKQMLKKLKVVAGEEHKHEAQQPTKVRISRMNTLEIE